MTPGNAPAPGPPSYNVVLIGYRGCGKTSVGRTLAARLGWSFADTDDLVVAAAGRSIADIFAQDGESAFRRLEVAAIRQVTGGASQVIAVGGGAVLSAVNRDALRAAGLCVWLTASPEVLWRRMQLDPAQPANRPALTELPGLDEVRHLLGQREPLYAALARHVVDTTDRSIVQVAAEVYALLASPDSANA